MPAQTGKSILMAKLGNEILKAHQAVKDSDETVQDFSRLPAGIENGVAKLVDMKFDEVKEGKDNAGSVYFYAAGVVVHPREFIDSHGAKHQLEGKRTSLTIPLYPTPNRQGRKTVQDHLDFLYKHLRGFGVNTKQFKSPMDTELVVAALRKRAQQNKGPYFKFRTWKGQVQTTGPYKDREPMTNESWGMACEWNETTQSAVEDATAQPLEPVDTTESKPVDTTESNGEVFDEFTNPSDETTTDEGEDLDALAALADPPTDDGEAQDKLTALAEEAGVPQRKVTNAKSWVAVVQMIRDAKPTEEVATETGDEEASDDDAGDQASDEPAPPDKTDIVGYKVRQVVNGKPRMKLVQCEVTGVNKSKKTVALKEVDGKATFKDVPWDKLEAV